MQRGTKPKEDYQALEQALSDLLNGNPAPTPTKNRPTFKTHTIRLTYSVRHHWGGRRFRVHYDYNTFNLFEAETKAAREMAKSQYIEQVLVEVIKGEISSKKPH